jgi:glyoxylate reductase
VTRVLVVDKVLPFLEAERIPNAIEPVVFTEAEGVPAGDFGGVIPVVTTRVDAHAMDRMRGLKVIANYGVGFDNVDVAGARARGIQVSNTPGVLTDATAELTWALILATARRLGEGERMVRRGTWAGWAPTQMRGMGLKGKTLGIVGYGRIGRAVAERAVGFGMRVEYWSRSSETLPLAELLRTADVVSIHLSKSRETEGVVDPRLLKDGALLINTARGAIVNESLLIEELKRGRISAGLDVYIDEPDVPEPLLTLDNVVLLPHLGSATYEARQAMWDLAWANLLRGVRGEVVVNPV